MDPVVVITTVEMELVAWVGAISFFISVAMTAVVSPNRQWFELVVIFGLVLLTSILVVGLLVQWVGGVTLVDVELIETLDRGRFS